MFKSFPINLRVAHLYKDPPFKYTLPKVEYGFGKHYSYRSWYLKDTNYRCFFVLCKNKTFTSSSLIGQGPDLLNRYMQIRILPGGLTLIRVINQTAWLL